MKSHTVDYSEVGHGPPVILVHSSASGNRQWRALTDLLKGRFRVIALNLYGYGATPAWGDARRQTLADQAALVLALCERLPGPIHLVGHSSGGSIAFKAATRLGPRLGRLALVEPNPFWLLRQNGRLDGYAEASGLRDHVKRCGRSGTWDAAAARFADYWLGDGAWAAMPERRRQAFAAAMPPVFHEWDAVMEEETTLRDWRALPRRTLLLSARGTRRPIRQIVELLESACPRWMHAEVAQGGHMAPLTRPDLVNPLIEQFLEAA